VSALIHAATLVTAGIYLMVRLGPFMAGSDLVILVGCLTAFMAGVFGFFQSDLKRVIAFSTCSQLGCPQNISISNLNKQVYLAQYLTPMGLRTKVLEPLGFSKGSLVLDLSKSMAQNQRSCLDLADAPKGLKKGFIFK
jgi:hypothetical protein